jgi:hypothetical protein
MKNIKWKMTDSPDATAGSSVSLTLISNIDPAADAATPAIPEYRGYRA